MVSGVKDGDSEKYALSATVWEEWLAYFINNKMAERLTNEEIVAHCLYEMTWHGFTQEKIQQKIRQITE